MIGQESQIAGRYFPPPEAKTSIMMIGVVCFVIVAIHYTVNKCLVIKIAHSLNPLVAKLPWQKILSLQLAGVVSLGETPFCGDLEVLPQTV